MSIYPKSNNDPELLKTTTKNDEITDLKYKIEKHDQESNLKSLKIDHDYYEKKYKSLNKKVLLNITENLIGSGSALGTFKVTILKSSIGTVLTSSTALLLSIAILITTEYISKLEKGYTKLRDWMNFITLLYETSMVHKKI